MPQDEPFLTIKDDLVPRLQSLRDWAERSAPPDIYVKMIEACAICEGLANPDCNKTVNFEDVAAQLRRRGIQLVRKTE